MPGRLNKPRALEEAEGFPGKGRRIRKDDSDPDFDRVIPEPPEHLSAVAVKKWHELAPMLFRVRVLTEADQVTLGNLCEAYATSVRAQKKLQTTDLIYFDKESRKIKANPLFAMSMQSMEMVTRLCREFGLTPSSRAKLNVGMPDKVDALDDALFGTSAERLN
jgi:P27 family predicted phage terminase small subunit